MLKAVYLSRAIEKRPQIRKFCLNSKKNSHCKDQNKSTVLGYY